MTPDIDDLLLGFRADQPGPAAGAEQRILRRALAPAAPARRRRLGWRASTLALGAAAAAATSVVALWPSSGPTPSPLERAAAAIAPPDGVVHLQVRVTYQTADASGRWADGDTIAWHDFSQLDGHSIVRLRRFISADGLDAPPTDEDSVLVAGPDGRVAATSWVAGELREETLPAELTLDSISIAGMLREAYESGALALAEERDGTLVLRATAADCGQDAVALSEVVVDAKTFLPSRAVEGGPCPGTAPKKDDSRQVWSVTSVETLPDSAENRALLELGDWPLGTADEPAEVVEG